MDKSRTQIRIEFRILKVKESGKSNIRKLKRIGKQQGKHTD